MKATWLLLAALFSFGTVFAETGSETEKEATGGGSSNATVFGQSYTVEGTYIAGTGSAQASPMTSKGFKLRTGSDGGRAVFTVNENYTITKLYLAGIGNYDKKDAEGEHFIFVSKVEVDGVEVEFEGGDFPAKGSSTAGELTIDNISATQTIAIYFDNSNAGGNQINASWAISWERPDATQPTITVSPQEINLITGATYQLSAKVDPASFQTSWKSVDETIATVSETGLVTAVSEDPGVTTIINVWDDDESVYGAATIYVNSFDPADYEVVKNFDFKSMDDTDLTIETEAAGAIWNEGNKKVNNVFFCTNEGLEDIAVQAVLSGGKGWSIIGGEGLKLASGAGRCAAIGHLKEGQVVEIIYTGSNFYTGSKEDAVRKDDGATKNALNEGVGRAIYVMLEDGMLGFELDKGNSIEKVVVYDMGDIPIEDPDEVVFDFAEDGIDQDGSYLMATSVPYDLDFSSVTGVKAYVVSDKNKDNWGAVTSVTLKPIEMVPANTGIVLKAEAAQEYAVPVADNLFVEQFTNLLVTATATIDLYDAVKTDWGDFVSGPTELVKGTFVKGYDEQYNAIFGVDTGFFPYAVPASPGTAFIEPGQVYLPIAEGEWDAWGYGYVKLQFADQAVPEYANIGALTAIPVQQNAEGEAAKLNMQYTADVNWTNGQYMLVSDYSGGVLMQVPEGVTVAAGDIIAGSYTGNYINILFPQLLVSPMTNADDLMVLDNMGAPVPAEATLEGAFDAANVMRLVKVSSLNLVVDQGTWSSDYYVANAEDTEVYLNDAFGMVSDQLATEQDGAVVDEVVGFGFIIPDDSPYLTYGYPKYEFVPLSIKMGTAEGITTVAQEQGAAKVYDLQGRRVQNVQKGGVYILNGKKMVVK